MFKYFVFTTLLFPSICLTCLTWIKSNKYHSKFYLHFCTPINILKHTVQYAVLLVLVFMCLFSKSMLYVEKLQWEHRKVFLLCVALIWATLRATIHFLPLTLITTGSSGSTGWLLSCTRKGNGTSNGPFDPVGLMAISCGVTISVDIYFRLLSSWGKSPGSASLHTSSNKSQPLAIVFWPSETILCPAATVLMATSKTYTNLSVMFDI